MADKILSNEKDWYWHCMELDVSHKQKFEHNNAPIRYPCKVKSEYHYEDNHPDWYSHEFKYRVEKKCPECGHVEYVWSDEWE